MTLKDVNDSSYENMLLNLKTEAMEIYQQHRYLLDSEDIYDEEKEKIKDILFAREDEVTLRNCVRELTKYLFRVFQKPVMLFLDEYDVPLQNAYVEGYYDKAIKFFKTFYGATFKDNSYLEKTIITGVSRVAKESIFSGANNFKVYTVLDNEFATDFGITEQEMNKIIQDFNVKDEKEEIKKWYDGYKIGNCEGIYNPWSIINYLADKKLQPYWINTSSNDLIKMTLKNSTTIKEKIERLLKDEPIEAKVNQETIMVDIEKNEDNIWGLLVGTGYLKVIERMNGKMIYIREEYEKINVYQTEYKIDKYESVNSQVEEIIREFEEMCKNYLNISDEDKTATEVLYGELKQKEEIPLGESIYNDNRLYSKTYEKEEKTYDINFYRNGEKIICEFVYNV